MRTIAASMGSRLLPCLAGFGGAISGDRNSPAHFGQCIAVFGAVESSQSKACLQWGQANVMALSFPEPHHCQSSILWELLIDCCVQMMFSAIQKMTATDANQDEEKHKLTDLAARLDGRLECGDRLPGENIQSLSRCVGKLC